MKRLADEIEEVADAIYNHNALRSRQLSAIAHRVAQMEISRSADVPDNLANLVDVLRDAQAISLLKEVVEDREEAKWLLGTDLVGRIDAYIAASNKGESV